MFVRRASVEAELATIKAAAEERERIAEEQRLAAARELGRYTQAAMSQASPLKR